MTKIKKLASLKRELRFEGLRGSYFYSFVLLFSVFSFYVTSERSSEGHCDRYGAMLGILGGSHWGHILLNKYIFLSVLLKVVGRRPPGVDLS